MDNSSVFLKKLSEIKEQALTNNNKISSSEVKSFFSDMQLSEDDFQNIYKYLFENKITITDVLTYSKNENSKEATNDSDSKIYDYYLNDIKEVSSLSDDELMNQFEMLINNDPLAFERLTHHFLKTVVDIANKYSDCGLLMEDLVQEGNIGLLTALSTINTITTKSDFIPYIEENIKFAILEYIDEMNAEFTLTDALIAKSNLVSEAATQLEKELMHPPTVDELADYTRLTVEEIRDIINLAASKK